MTTEHQPHTDRRLSNEITVKRCIQAVQMSNESDRRIWGLLGRRSILLVEKLHINLAEKLTRRREASQRLTTSSSQIIP